MKTFFNILQTIVHVKYKVYLDEPFIIREFDINEYSEIKIHVKSLVTTIFYEINKCKETPYYVNNAAAKLGSLNKIIENMFYKKELKEEILNTFSTAQKYYYAFSKLAHIYKLKNYPSIVTDDLSMTPLDISHKNTFILLDKKCKYLFNLNDLISIIENAIGHSPDFFSEPLTPLNPYNKQPFTLSTLYNIYFKMKETRQLISVLFHFFFLQNFCKNKFSEHHEEYIRETAIKKYIFNSPYTILYPHIFVMLNSNIYTIKLRIHPEFPKKILVDIFRPFLYYYYIINYDISGTNKIYTYQDMLNTKLKQFYRYNKAFGQKYSHITAYFGKIVKTEYKFNTDHINFYGVTTPKQHEQKNYNIFINPNTISNTINYNTITSFSSFQFINQNPEENINLSDSQTEEDNNENDSVS